MANLTSQLKLTVLDGVTGRMRGISAALSGFQARTRALSAPMMGVTSRLLALGAGYVGVAAGIRGTLGAAIKFEEAFADVRKVVDASDYEFANFAQTIKKMSTELPLTAVDIAALWAAAGESGIANNELASFADMAAKVGIAFDMSAGEAGESLAKLKAQLGLTVAETGDMADAINHLSNNMASKAPEIVDYMLRVGKFAEMGGFHRDQIAAIGSAMISAGADSSKAGTAMMNVVRKMTAGQFAKKAQATAAKTLGLHLPTLAKEMQKDAPKALKSVLKAISKQSKDKHISLLSEFFGDEARAFAPLVGNVDLLDQALDSVADKANYAGSAFAEYVQRANTASNALQLLRNKVAFVFQDIGEGWLPTLKEGIKGIGDVLDTLGERVNIFEKIGWAFKGFANGLGIENTKGARALMNDLGDFLLGKNDASAAADTIGRIFKTFQDLGKSVAEFGETYKDNPLVAFLGQLSGYGFKLMLAAVGIGALAKALWALGKAAAFLSGFTTVVSIVKGLAGVGGVLFGAAGGTAAASAASTAGAGAAGGGLLATLGKWLKGIGGTGLTGAWASLVQGIGDTPGDTFGAQVENQRKSREALQRLFGLGGPSESTGRAHTSSPSAPAPQTTPFSFGQLWRDLMAPIGSKPSDLSIRTLPPITGSVTTQPTGNQQVTVTNPTPVHAPISVTVYATTNASAEDIGAAVGARVSSAIDGYYGDGA